MSGPNDASGVPMTVEERARQFAQDESIAALAMVCGRLWQASNGCDVSAPTKEEMAAILMKVIEAFDQARELREEVRAEVPEEDTPPEPEEGA